MTETIFIVTSRFQTTVVKGIRNVYILFGQALIIGVCNTRQKIISVVDTIPAPCDSSRTSSKFVLGNKGLEIQKRLKQSGNTLIDLGTWHSHLRDSKPSKLDWTTATKLSQERSIPYILLVFTPNKIYAISKSSYE